MVTVQVGQHIISGIKSHTASASLDNLARAFSFELLTSFEVVNALANSDVLTFLVNGQPFLTGFIDVMSNDGSVIQVKGRSRLSTVVDSSYRGRAEYPAGSVFNIIKEVLKDHGVIIHFLAEDVKVEKVSLMHGQSLQSVLTQLSRLASLYFTENVAGELVVNQSKTFSSDDEVMDIKSRSHEVAFNKLNSSVTVISVGSGVGRKNNSLKATAGNEDVSRYKPLVLTVKTTDLASVTKLAEFKVNQQKASLDSLTYTTLQTNYLLGSELNINDPVLDVRGKFAINSVSHQSSAQGSTSTITLVDPAKFSIQPKLKMIDKVRVGAKKAIRGLRESREIGGFRYTLRDGESSAQLTARAKDKIGGVKINGS